MDSDYFSISVSQRPWEGGGSYASIQISLKTKVWRCSQLMDFRSLNCLLFLQRWAPGHRPLLVDPSATPGLLYRHLPQAPPTQSVQTHSSSTSNSLLLFPQPPGHWFSVLPKSFPSFPSLFRCTGSGSHFLLPIWVSSLHLSPTPF